jgi:hypothetical protein
MAMQWMIQNTRHATGEHQQVTHQIRHYRPAGVLKLTWLGGHVHIRTCTSDSLSVSRAEVASSSKSREGPVSRARAMAMRWRCPPLNCAPRSPTTWLYLHNQTHNILQGTHKYQLPWNHPLSSIRVRRAKRARHRFNKTVFQVKGLTRLGSAQ